MLNSSKRHFFLLASADEFYGHGKAFSLSAGSVGGSFQGERVNYPRLSSNANYTRRLCLLEKLINIFWEIPHTLAKKKQHDIIRECEIMNARVIVVQIWKISLFRLLFSGKFSNVTRVFSIGGAKNASFNSPQKRICVVF